MNQEYFDIREFDNYKEGNCLEVKKASGGLPQSLWETYSAFANCNGGVIILGVEEKSDGSWFTTGLKGSDARKLIKSFWDTINNHSKVSTNLLSENDVKPYIVKEDLIIVIHVPMARRQYKPVFLNGDIFGHSYRRNNEGDYHCTRAQVKAMLRDQTDDTLDMEILENVPMDYLNQETILGYRNRHKSLKVGHPFDRLTDNEFLRSIGAAAISERDGDYHPTGAGLLMFGYEYNIVRRYPEYFLDYREILDPVIRWTDRLQSSSGDWSGNIFDFYFRVYNKIIKEVKVPFKMVGGTRIDDTPLHKALREALANCLVNADFNEPRGVVIKLDNHKLTLENPGYIRVGRKQILIGGVSDPRNKGLMKMFNLIDIGERAGSGVPDILNVWNDSGFEPPSILEEFDPGRTILVLSFERKATKKSDEIKATKKSDEITISVKTQKQLDTILDSLTPGKWYKSSDIMELLGLQQTRTKKLLRILIDSGKLISDGTTKNKQYMKNSLIK